MDEFSHALLGLLTSGERVFGGGASHLSEHPTVKPFLAAALSRICGERRSRIYEEIDFKRVIGGSHCVSTGLGDEIIYAQRKNRNGLTRFVKNRLPEPSSHVTVVLTRQDDGTYFLRTAFIGRRAPQEPWDVGAGEDAIEFWNTHALTWGFVEVIPGTETDICPWGMSALAKELK